MSELSGKIHDLYSQRLYLPLSNLQRAVRPARRAVASAFRNGLSFRESALTWSDDQKREWVINRLRTVVRTAANQTEYYRDLFTAAGFDPNVDFTFDDFARLPILEREDINRAGQTLLSGLVTSEQLKKDSTGGSTGEPTVVWLGPEEQGWRESSTESFMRRIGVPIGTRTSLLWGHHLDPVKKDNPRDRFYAFSTNERWFDCFRMSPDLMDAYHREMSSVRPACIVAYATALGRFAEHILECGYEAGYPSRCAVTGAEKLSPHHREAIETAFKRPVHERYGSRDVGGIAFQMNPQRALDYEVDWANMLVEPETDDPESPILITKLHADGMPMLRYRIGDIGRFTSGARPGHPALSLREVIGREADCVWTPNGHRIQGEFIPHMMKGFPVREYMLYQNANYSVQLKIVPKAGFNEQSRREILNTILSNLPDLKLDLVVVDEIPRTKASKLRAVMSEVHAASIGPSRVSRRSKL
jgi:phenylacetate-CoA ligase